MSHHIGFVVEAVGDPTGLSILDVGSRDWDGPGREGTPQPYLAPRAASYLGVDIMAGDAVDELVDVGALAATFGLDAFDVVICLEVLEHVADWSGALSNLKAVLRPGGLLVIAVPGPGFRFHGYPDDHWRYTPEMSRDLVNDMVIEAIAYDPETFGTFLAARKHRPAGPVPV